VNSPHQDGRYFIVVAGVTLPSCCAVWLRPRTTAPISSTEPTNENRTRMRIRPKFLTTIALLATTAGFGVPAVPAFADDGAYLTQNQYLAYDAPVGSPQSCIQRSIYLASGNYLWTIFVGRLDEWDSRTIYLRADTYIWTTCIVVVGKVSHEVARYEETTWVRGSAKNEANVTTTNYLGSTPSSSHVYNWGSRLLKL
jgi:hypothetical protein